MTETEKWIENEFLPCLVKKTCVILDNSSEELTKLDWHTGESNTDTDFSNFAKNCCIQAFNEIDIRFNIQLKIDVPDLNLTLKLSKDHNYLPVFISKVNKKNNFLIILKSFSPAS